MMFAVVAAACLTAKDVKREKNTLKLKPIIDKSLRTIKLVLRGINHARRVKQLSSIFLVKMRTVFDQVTVCSNSVKGVLNRHLHPFIQSISIRWDAESWRMSTRNAAQSSDVLAVSVGMLKKGCGKGCKKVLSPKV